MSATKKEKSSDSIEVLDQQEAKKKTCFVIMPIAETGGYEHGHFTRVYRHLIKPACERAGFIPIRADDVSSSNMIVVDILKKIVESDIAICDLSSRNPNVLYELGLRQAFNKKTIIIKDKDTSSPFDVSGFRYTEYDQILRIDNVQNEIISISKALKDTFESKDDINSIVQLLKIKPAEIGDMTKLNTNETFMLNVLNSLQNKIDKLSSNSSFHSKNKLDPYEMERIYKNLGELLNVYSLKDIVNEKLLNFYFNGENLGGLVDIDYQLNAMLFRNEIIYLTEATPKDITFDTDIPF
ncbi:hypothetical protein MIB43_012660 [Providencia rettgeri]|uniref:hypothetical protein n=1 Tax=Providencia rettgeri TaxID=587 RepID=UPI001F0385C7|nr:hypothetical protein [Providencia rettgeri]MCG9950774.1 hypothetical protein [Providencia rettgeri]